MAKDDLVDIVSKDQGGAGGGWWIGELRGERCPTHSPPSLIAIRLLTTAACVYLSAAISSNQ